MHECIFPLFVSGKIDDSIEKRKSELVEERAGLEDGSSIASSRSVEEGVSEDFSKDVFVEGKEGSWGGHGWSRRGTWDRIKTGKEEGNEMDVESELAISSSSPS